MARDNNNSNRPDPEGGHAASADTTTTDDPGHPKKDRLSRKQLAANYGWALRVIAKNGEIKDLFQRAVKRQWDAARFEAELRNTQWYANNSEYARMAWRAENTGGEDWDSQLQAARVQVSTTAAAMGASLTEEELNDYARDYLYEGWFDAKRQGLLEQALAGYGENRRGRDFVDQLDPAAGGMATLIEQLKAVAGKNGVKQSDDYYRGAARSIVAGLSDASTWERDIRERAASMFPVYREKILAGVDVEDLASGYMTMVRDVLEVPEGDITLDNKYIQQALSGVDPEKGTPRAMGLWDFKKLLKQDESWKYTQNAHQEVGKVTMDVLRQFGFGV